MRLFHRQADPSAGSPPKRQEEQQAGPVAPPSAAGQQNRARSPRRSGRGQGAGEELPLERGSLRFGVREALLALLVLGSVAALAWDFPWWKPVEGAGLYYVGRPEPPANEAAFREAAALIPPGASLATDNNLGPQFAHRRYLYFFPYWEAWRADTILLDLQRTPPTDDARTQALRLLLGCPLPALAGQSAESSDPSCRGGPGEFAWDRYGVRFWRDGMLLLVRGYPPDPLLHRRVLETLGPTEGGAQLPIPH